MGLTRPPTTSLGRLVQAEHQAARVENKQRSKTRRLLRMLGITVAAFYFVLGFGSGSAQAVPDPVGDAVEKVTHFCGPMDVPPPSSHEGFDTSLGLNKGDSDLRRTVRTTIDDDLAKDTDTLGIDRARKAYSASDEKIINTPTYERYGFNTLRWTNYGSSCFSPSYWFSPITNFAFAMFVKFPMILGMGLLNFAMDPDNVLYQAFTLILEPFVKIFTAIFEPWIYLFAPLGVLWVWIKSKASVQATLQAIVWCFAIIAVFTWMGNNTSTIVTKANNAVTSFTGSAACHMLTFNDDDGGSSGKKENCQEDAGLTSINQALWHGVPYQTWLLGEVGPGEAQDSTRDEAAGDLGWGPVILNGMYVNYDDDGGKEVLGAIQYWNSRSYHSTSGDDTKAGYWTGDSAEGDGDDEIDHTNGAAWEDIPFLAHVKFICDDKTHDGNGSEEASDNRWMYKNQCNYTGAGTKDLVSYFKGDEYAHQMVVAFAGGWATLAVVLAIGLAAIYLMLQKMLFFFLLAFGPIFLAMSTFADEKRRRFATRYFEILAANIIKQCVAVCVMLFVSYSMAALMNPPANSNFPNIPWMAKPIFAMLFFIALVIFMVPMANLMKAVAKGDSSVVDKVANAPANYAKNTTKGAALAAAVVATGGAAAAAGAAGGSGMSGAAASVGKAGTTMKHAGAMLGRRGGVGKALSTAGRMNTLASGLMNNKVAKASEKEAIRQGALMVARSNPRKYQTDAEGQLTPLGLAAATADFKKTSADGLKHQQTQQLAQQQMKNFFAGHLAKTGQRHAADPENPDNKASRRGSNGANPRPRPKHEGKTPSGPGIEIPDTPGIEIPDTPFREAEPNYQPHQYFVDVARSRVDQPTWGRDDISIASITPASTVLASSGLSRETLVANPVTLVSGDVDAYSAGDVTQMDPAHPLTPVMHQLRQAVATGDEAHQAEAQRLLDEASAIIASRGVPDQVQGFRAAATSAFTPAKTIGAMADLDERAGWRDRAEAAFTVQCAATALPEGHPVADSFDTYSRALSDPAVDLTVVRGLRDEVIHALNNAREWKPSASPEPAPEATKHPHKGISGDQELRLKPRGRSGLYDYDDEGSDDGEGGGGDDGEDGAGDEDDRRT